MVGESGVKRRERGVELCISGDTSLLVKDEGCKLV